MNNWRQLPKAKKAVDEEWTKLEKKRAWLYDTVREYEDVRKEHEQNGNETHFGDLLRLCHVKHSELEAKFHRYKGRVVFRGGTT